MDQGRKFSVPGCTGNADTSHSLPKEPNTRRDWLMFVYEKIPVKFDTQFLSVTTALQSARAASRSSVIILLDLSAAFDTVNHQILLARLSEMGITGTALQWISSYLSGRSYQVSWGGKVSGPRQLSTRAATISRRYRQHRQ